MIGSTEKLQKLEISLDNIEYDKKEKRISIEILDFTFIGQYYNSTQLDEIIDDLFKSLRDIEVSRDKIMVIDPKTNSPIDQDTKLKYLDIIKKPEEEEEPEEITSVRATTSTVYEEVSEEEVLVQDTAVMDFERKKKIKASKKKMKRLEDERPSIPAGAKMESATVLKESVMSDLLAGSPPSAPASTPQRPIAAASTPPPTREKVYDINMGLQYYAVLMEQQTYLFYVYLSHKELIIEDEEGKTVYETTFQIVTTKEEPPQLDLRIEGTGFEIHPIRCTMVVDENAISQPVMIFSITALVPKDMSEQERKKGYRRYLHIFIDFEDKTVSHTILSTIIQTKHISLKLGPINLNLSKVQAIGVCLLSISISLFSFIYTLLNMDFSTIAAGGTEGILPGAGSLTFLLSFMMTVLKKGVFPIKKKVAGMIDFTKTAAMMK